MANPKRIQSCLAAIIAFAAIGGSVARAQSAVSESQLETFLGLNPGSGLNSGDLTNLGNGPVTSGSAIMQSITVSAGAKLTFDFDFLTNAPPPATNLLGAVNPFAFFTTPTLTDFADNYSTYPSSMPSAPPQTGFLYQSGYTTETISFATAGTYTLGIGVANVTTDSYGSALLLDNFSLTGGSLANGMFSTGDFSGWSNDRQRQYSNVFFRDRSDQWSVPGPFADRQRPRAFIDRPAGPGRTRRRGRTRAQGEVQGVN